jgi:hypothetical protein
MYPFIILSNVIQMITNKHIIKEITRYISLFCSGKKKSKRFSFTHSYDRDRLYPDQTPENK